MDTDDRKEPRRGGKEEACKTGRSQENDRAAKEEGEEERAEKLVEAEERRVHGVDKDDESEGRLQQRESEDAAGIGRSQENDRPAKVEEEEEEVLKLLKLETGRVHGVDKDDGSEGEGAGRREREEAPEKGRPLEDDRGAKEEQEEERAQTLGELQIQQGRVHGMDKDDGSEREEGVQREREEAPGTGGPQEDDRAEKEEEEEEERAPKLLEEQSEQERVHGVDKDDGSEGEREQREREETPKTGRPQEDDIAAKEEEKVESVQNLVELQTEQGRVHGMDKDDGSEGCLLYTSDAADD